MGFSNDHKQAAQSDYSLKPEGDYEVIIKSIEEKKFSTGTKGINLKLLIRNDVPNQRFGNGFLFHTFWKRKQPTELDKQVNGYSYGQLMNLSKSANLPDGKSYETLEEFFADLVDKCIRVTVKHDDYNDKWREVITWITETKYPECKHVYKDRTQNDGFAQNNNQAFAQAAVSAAAQPSIENHVPDDLPF